MLKRRRQNYTVVELITVIVIVGMVSALAVSRFRRMPAFLSLESQVSGLKKLMAQARNNAVCLGRNTQLMFDAENRFFYISRAQTQPEDDEENQASRGSGVRLPEEIKLKVNGEEFEDDGASTPVFKFYPDGTGGGGSLTLQLDDYAFRIAVSPLSGSITDEEVEVSE